MWIDCSLYQQLKGTIVKLKNAVLNLNLNKLNLSNKFYHLFHSYTDICFVKGFLLLIHISFTNYLW